MAYVISFDSAVSKFLFELKELIATFVKASKFELDEAIGFIFRSYFLSHVDVRAWRRNIIGSLISIDSTLNGRRMVLFVQ